MRRVVATLFALALAATVLAGDGVVLVPHSHALGAPADHPHGLALYRFPIALLGSPPDAATSAGRPSRDPAFRLARPLAETLAGASLILAVMLVLVSAAPSRRRAPRLLEGAPSLPGQWWALVPTGPPRFAPLSV